MNTSTGVDIKNVHTGGKRSTENLGTSRADIVNGDATSINSNDGKQLIIKKDLPLEMEQETPALL